MEHLLPYVTLGAEPLRQHTQVSAEVGITGGFDHQWKELQEVRIRLSAARR